MSNIVRYSGEVTRGPSPALWGNLSKVVTDSQMGKCAFVFDDFCKAPYYSANDTAAQVGDYYCWTGNGGHIGASIPTLSEGEAGVLELYHDNTDNDEVSLAINGGATTLTGWCQINDTAGEDFKTLFEARVKIDVLTVDVNSIFVGLCNPVAVANTGKADATGVMMDTSYIGFDSLCATPSVLSWSYRNGGGAAQTDTIATAHTLVADTWVKLGFIYDPTALTAKRIKCFVNGVEKSTYITGTNIAASTFPDADSLAPTLMVKTGTTTVGYLYCDWIAACQYVDYSG